MATNPPCSIDIAPFVGLPGPLLVRCKRKDNHATAVLGALVNTPLAVPAMVSVYGYSSACIDDPLTHLASRAVVRAWKIQTGLAKPDCNDLSTLLAALWAGVPMFPTVALLLAAVDGLHKGEERPARRYLSRHADASTTHGIAYHLALHGINTVWEELGDRYGVL